MRTAFVFSCKLIVRVGRPADTLSYEFVTRDVTTVSLVHFELVENDMLLTLVVLKKFGPNRSDVREEQSLNIIIMFVTEEVSKLVKSSDVRDEHKKNIVCMFVTAEVSKLVKSSDVREEQLLNMECIIVTAEVSKLVKSSDVREEQP